MRPTVRKNLIPLPNKPVPYKRAYAAFDLAKESNVLSGSLATGLNACFECCIRHAQQSPQSTALYFVRENSDSEELYTFAELAQQAARFANLLRAQGVRIGDSVATLLPKSPELLVTMLGTWLAGAVHEPLFAAFSPKTIAYRLSKSKARLLVTNGHHRARLERSGPEPDVIVVSDGAEVGAKADLDFRSGLRAHSAVFDPVLRSANEPFLQLFTSGTTAAPKSVAVPLKALPAFVGYMRDAVDLRPNDVLWCLADPAWSYGLYAGVLGPLAMGRPTFFYDGAYSAKAIVDQISKRQITNLLATPTIFRLLMSAGTECVLPIKGQLRVASSAGEPLLPAVSEWFSKYLDVNIYDHYGQTEVGIVLANHHRLRHPVRPGSVGFPVPGYRMAVLDHDGSEAAANSPGALVIDRGASPLMWFQGYEDQDNRGLRGRYYRTGDLAEMHADGSFTILGRRASVGLDGAVNIRAPSTTVGAKDRAIWRKRAVTTDTTRKKREFVLRVASQMINERGFAATSMTDIATQLNVTKPTIYYYFQNKDEILFEALELGLRQLRNAVASRKGGLSDVHRLSDVFRTYVDIVSVGYGGGVLRAAEHELAEGNRKRLAQLKLDYEATIRDVIVAAATDGCISVKHVEAATATVLGALNWIAARRDQPPTQLQEVSQRVVETLLAGLQPRQ